MKRSITLIILFTVLASCGTPHNFNKQKFTKLKNVKTERQDVKSIDENSIEDNITFLETDIDRASRRVDRKSLTTDNYELEILEYIEIDIIHEERHEIAEIIEDSKLDSPLVSAAPKLKKLGYKSEITNKSVTTSPFGIFIGIILCLVNLSPLGVLLAVGKGRGFNVNLIIYLIGTLSCLLGIVSILVFASVGEFIGLILFGIGTVIFIVALIHGLVVIARGD